MSARKPSHPDRAIATAIPKLVCLLLTACWAGTAAAGERPVAFEIPRLPTAPVIDGRIEDSEWRQATALTGGVAPQNNYLISELQFVAWLGWDEEALYLAIRSWQRPGRAFDFGGESTNDNIEFSVLSYTSEDLRHPHRMFLSADGVTPSDIAGMRSRIERPPIITRAERANGWTDGVETASRTLPDPHDTLGEGTQIWELEARFPRATFSISQPNAAGDGARILLARNHGEPRAQVHLPLTNRAMSAPGVGGIGYFFDPRGYMQARLVQDVPVVQFLDSLSLLRGKGCAGLRYFNPTAAPVDLTATITVRNPRTDAVVYQVTDTVTVPPGQAVDRTAAVPDAKDGGRLDITVTGPGNRSILEYQADFKSLRATGD